MKPIKLIQNHTPRLNTIVPAKSKIKLITSKETVIIQKSDILYLQSSSNYCEVFFVNGKKMLCSQTLKSIESKLKDSNFYRPHNSYVVNINYLSSITSSYAHLKLMDDIMIPISRSKKSELKTMTDVWYD